MRIIKEVRNSRRDNEDSAHLRLLVHGHCPTGHREYGELPRSFGGLMWVVFPRSLFASPYVSFSVVQLTSTSTPFSNKSWRYVALYSGITDVLRREDWDNIPTEAHQTARGLTEQHPIIYVPVEKRGEGGQENEVKPIEKIDLTGLFSIIDLVIFSRHRSMSESNLR